MADTTTTNLTMTKPEVGASSGTWGGGQANSLSGSDGDGTGWNPGSGEGLYARVAGAWAKL